VGGVVRARALAKRLDCDLAIIDKRRPKANVAEVMNIIGEVEGRTCVIMDDMVDTAGTLTKAAAGAEGPWRPAGAGVLHPPGAFGRRGRRGSPSRQLDELVVTDTIPLPRNAPTSGKIRVLSCAQLLAETILRINRADSVSSLFVD
jgi:ribose-phosphate pyrophosphokinase